MGLQLRRIEDNDLHFIYSTMLRGLYFSNDYYNKIEKRNFYKQYSPIIEQIVKISRASSLIACLDDDSSVIVGYSLVNGPIMHWCYVKSAWRRQGILTLMLNTLEHSPKSCSHLSNVGDAIRLKKDVEFDPFTF